MLIEAQTVAEPSQITASHLRDDYRKPNMRASVCIRRKPDARMFKIGFCCEPSRRGNLMARDAVAGSLNHARDERAGADAEQITRAGSRS